MNKKFASSMILITILLSTFFSMAPINKACAEAKDGKSMGEAGLIWRLDLTKEQKDLISNKENEMRKEILALRQPIRELRNQLNAELSASSPDKEKVNKLIESISANMTGIQKKEISFMIWMREQLTPEQKQKLNDLIKNRQQTAPDNQEQKGQ